MFYLYLTVHQGPSADAQAGPGPSGRPSAGLRPAAEGGPSPQAAASWAWTPHPGGVQTASRRCPDGAGGIIAPEQVLFLGPRGSPCAGHFYVSA